MVGTIDAAGRRCSPMSPEGPRPSFGAWGGAVPPEQSLAREAAVRGSHLLNCLLFSLNSVMFLQVVES